jgi:short-subunit dehydrogenase
MEAIETVVITGAAGTLGRAFAAECAARGWSLFLTDVDRAALARLSLGLERCYCVRTAWAACDLTSPTEREEFVRQMRAARIRPTMLVNIAGLDFEGALAERTREALLTIVRLNVEATLDITRAAIDLSDGGVGLRVVTVSSLAAFYPMPLKATYAASKRFLLQLSLGLREELRERGGSATALCPAGLPTREDARAAIEAQGLLGRLTTVDVNRVAASTIRAAVAGRAVHIPGLVNRGLRVAGALVPPTLLARVLHARWQATRASAHAMASSASAIRSRRARVAEVAARAVPGLDRSLAIE